MLVDPNFFQKIRILMNTRDAFGLWIGIKQFLAYLASRCMVALFFIKDDFDLKHGVSTAGWVPPAEGGITDRSAIEHARAYVPTQEEVIRHMFRVSCEAIDPQQCSLVDLGCGKGRALLVAAQLPFKEIVGVELSPVLSDIARENVRRYLASNNSLACRNIRVACENALEFRFPQTDLLIYMYNPFGAEIMQAVATNLAQFQVETGRRVLIAYCCPDEEKTLEASQAFTKRAEYQMVNPEHSWNLWEIHPKPLRGPAGADAATQQG